MNGSSQTNLHSLWDSGLLTVRIRRDFQANNSLYYDHIHNLTFSEPFMDNDDDIQQWIKESINIVCSNVYYNEQDARMNSSVTFQLGESYYQRNIPIIERRLAQGGRRLGVLLNRLGQTRPTILTTVTKNLTLFILIGVIIAVFIIALLFGICLCIQCKRKYKP
jgi:hypothetical protein